MTDSQDFRWPFLYRAVFAAVALLVGAFYLWSVQAANPPFEWHYDKSGYYDLLARGIHIWLTKKDSGASTHWWLDWETKGFFPVSVPAGQQPTAVVEYASFCAEDSCVVLGGRDGVLRRFHKRYTRDDGGVARPVGAPGSLGVLPCPHRHPRFWWRSQRWRFWARADDSTRM